MDKFSIYEFLSFLLPGIILVYVINQTTPWYVIHLDSSIGMADGIVFFGISLLAGLFIHRATFFCVEQNFKWYKRSLYRPIKSYSNEKNIEKALKKIKEIRGEKKVEDYFDEAYWYLEAQDKIGTSKMFQSMYFFLRNMVMAYITLIPILVFFYGFSHNNLNIVTYFIGGLLISIVIMLFLADFYRMKMVERIFCNYAILIELE